MAGVSGGETSIRWADGAEDVRAAFAIREQVFYVEQGVPRQEEIDTLDDEALHLLAFESPGGRAIGTLRVLLFEQEAKIGRVAVEADWRRRGIASRMLDRALARVRELGYRRVRLSAQVAAVALYEQAGFAIESEPYEEAGIPHVAMGLTLSERAER